MEIKDIFFAPIYLLIIYAIAYNLRPKYTDKTTRKYFLPALTLKLFGGLAFGLIYQFYYKGGDTFNYFFHVKMIREAFSESISSGFQLLFFPSHDNPDIYKYVSVMFFSSDYYSYNVCRVAAFLSYLTFGCYSCITFLFASISFSGMWAFFRVLYNMYPALHRKFAICAFFIPSVFFWGSGLMKDTMIMTGIGWSFYGLYFGLVKKQNITQNILLVFMGFFTIQLFKLYVLLCFLPSILIWILLQYQAKVKSFLIKITLLPTIAILSLPLVYNLVTVMTQNDDRYSLDKIAQTAAVNAEWIAYKSKADGSAYDLGQIDGTMGGMLSKFPAAVWVTLFRPYPWESKNIVMLFSSFEAFYFLLITIISLASSKISKVGETITTHPIIAFSLVFSIIFSFAVGVSTYNFGSLVRYKIPMIPFYLSAIFIFNYISKEHKKKKKKIILINTGNKVRL